jgi:formamidopyrimidine-DNA glycosylase
MPGSTIDAVPELPEVEYTRRLLQRAMSGKRIRRVVLRRKALRYPIPAGFTRRLEGQLVRRVTRRAKYLLLRLESDDVAVVHLGMSGWFRVRGASAARAAEDAIGTHDHVVFEMSNGGSVIFSDPRRFGFMTVIAADDISTHASLGRLGPEPLDRAFTARTLARHLSRRRISLKVALADQRIVAGLGNIYVSEALHRAGLSPRRRASTLVTRSGEPRPGLERLVEAIRDVLKTAIANQYRTGADDPFLVYDREGMRCPRRGCAGMITRIVQGGRSTFYCPKCQH